jgi:hypothetical protein
MTSCSSSSVKEKWHAMGTVEVQMVQSEDIKSESYC